MYVAIETSRRTNIGTILRCAVAFGCKAIIIIGDKDYGTHGAHGAQTRIKVLHFYTWMEFNQFSIDNNCYVYGIINSLSDSLNSNSSTLCSEIGKTTIFQSNKNIIFIVGNKFGELSFIQKEVCNEFIIVSFSGGDKFSRYVLIDTKLSICLHHYAASQGMVENSFIGEKYILSEPQQSSERFESKSSKNNENIILFNNSNDCVDSSDFNIFLDNQDQNDY